MPKWSSFTTEKSQFDSWRSFLNENKFYAAGLTSAAMEDSLVNFLKGLGELTDEQKQQIVAILFKYAEQENVLLEAIGDSGKPTKTFSAGATVALGNLLNSFPLEQSALNKVERAINQWANTNQIKFTAVPPPTPAAKPEPARKTPVRKTKKRTPRTTKKKDKAEEPKPVAPEEPKEDPKQFEKDLNYKLGVSRVLRLLLPIVTKFVLGNKGKEISIKDLAVELTKTHGKKDGLPTDPAEARGRIKDIINALGRKRLGLKLIDTDIDKWPKEILATKKKDLPPSDADTAAAEFAQQRRDKATKGAYRGSDPEGVAGIGKVKEPKAKNKKIKVTRKTKAVVVVAPKKDPKVYLSKPGPEKAEKVKQIAAKPVVAPSDEEELSQSAFNYTPSEKEDAAEQRRINREISQTVEPENISITTDNSAVDAIRKAVGEGGEKIDDEKIEGLIAAYLKLSKEKRQDRSKVNSAITQFLGAVNTNLVQKVLQRLDIKPKEEDPVSGLAAMLASMKTGLAALDEPTTGPREEEEEVPALEPALRETKTVKDYINESYEDKFNKLLKAFIK